MSRRPALVTQADVARALRAAKQAGPDWVIEITGATIRISQSAGQDQTAGRDPQPAFARGLADAP